MHIFETVIAIALVFASQKMLEYVLKHFWNKAENEIRKGRSVEDIINSESWSFGVILAFILVVLYKMGGD